MTRRLLLLLLTLASPALTGCIGSIKSPGIRVATDPPGARVLVDGQDTGFLTPAFLDLDGEDGRIDMELDGYQTATRMVRSDGRWDTTHWGEMELNSMTWRFPVWVDYDDFFTMWRFVSLYKPSRIFVRLRLVGDA